MRKKTQEKKAKKPLRIDPEHVFQFRCSPGLPCFTQCCQDVNIVLTPYDVLRLKNALGISSDEFHDRHTILISKEKKLIPMVILKMEGGNKRCPFVSEAGCRVYADRPWACRMYPLDINDDGTFRLVTNPQRCKGLEQDEKWRISEWLVDQGVPVYDEMNALFAQVTNPLRTMDLDIDNPRIYKMMFMACYNIDKFREFVFKSTFLDRFDVDPTEIDKIENNDLELLKFAFDWIQFGIFGKKTFRIKGNAIPQPLEETTS